VRGVGWIAFLTGPLVVLGYLAGGTLQAAWPRRRLGAVPGPLLEAVLTIAWITLSWEVIRRVAPPATEFPQ
jgi:hypothetical protein